MTAVIKNSDNAIAISDERRKSSASPNWLAMTLAIEFAVDVIDVGI